MRFVISPNADILITFFDLSNPFGSLSLTQRSGFRDRSRGNTSKVKTATARSKWRRMASLLPSFPSVKTVEQKQTKETKGGRSAAFIPPQPSHAAKEWHTKE